jgi:hypothetical protein
MGDLQQAPWAKVEYLEFAVPPQVHLYRVVDRVNLLLTVDVIVDPNTKELVKLYHWVVVPVRRFLELFEEVHDPTLLVVDYHLVSLRPFVEDLACLFQVYISHTDDSHIVGISEYLVHLNS